MDRTSAWDTMVSYKKIRVSSYDFGKCFRYDSNRDLVLTYARLEEAVYRRVATPYSNLST